MNSVHSEQCTYLKPTLCCTMFYFRLRACCSVGLEDAEVFISDFENSDSDTECACKYCFIVSFPDRSIHSSR